MVWDIREIEWIVDNHQYKKVQGLIVDAVTARMVLTVFNALSPENQKKAQTMDLRKFVEFGWRCVK